MSVSNSVIEAIHPSRDLYPYLFPDASIAAEGTINDGGRIAVVDATYSIHIALNVPPVEFALFSLLMRRTLRRVDAQPAAGFVSKLGLYAPLRELGLIDNPQSVIRAVYRLRERLSQSVEKKLGKSEGDAWSRLLIETQVLGYRISVPPQNLRLNLLDAEQSAAGSSGRFLSVTESERDWQGIGRASTRLAVDVTKNG